MAATVPLKIVPGTAFTAIGNRQPGAAWASCGPSPGNHGLEACLMPKLSSFAAAFATAGFVLVSASAASAATCVKKGGIGQGGNDESAKFQAWEAVLQATDWGSWASFMTSGMKIGSAPGYKVSNVKTKCGKGSWGSECKIFATLCK